jgi:hypothetical protein
MEPQSRIALAKMGKIPTANVFAFGYCKIANVG